LGKMRLTKNTGMLLLGIWLILWGALSISSSGLGLVQAILAIAAGLLILIGR
jgi:hypothetical protein